jgi:glycosyltransferase involved in cell wall biosynthesis
MGIGTEIKRRFGVPVVCSLQDEDVWIDAMDPPYPQRCWETMVELGRDVEAFVAPSAFFAGLMAPRMKVEPARMKVVPVGVDPGDPPGPAPDPPVVGYLARMSRGMGLGTLVDAFLGLRKERFPRLRLHLSGGSTEDDESFLAELGDRFKSEGVAGDVQVFDDFDPAARKRFIRSLSVLSVPSPKPTAYGTYVLEANGAGVPAVQPRLGSYPELLEATGGGVLYEPNDAGTLAREIGGLLADRERAAELGRRGRDSVVKKFSWDMMAGGMLEVYRNAVSGRRP